MGRSITGTVISNSAEKTIVISVIERKTHPLYKKQYTVKNKYMAHDGEKEAKVGDLVVITECRPISARKRFTLKQVVSKSVGGYRESDATADIEQEPKDEAGK